MTDEDFAEAQRLFEGVGNLYLVGLAMAADQRLLVTVDEASREDRPQPLETGNAAVDAALGPAYPVTTRPGHRRFVVEFEPVASAIRDESFAVPEDDEDFSSPLRRYSTSTFLDWVERGTFVQSDEGPVRHVALVTFDVVIDVATQTLPEITVIRLTEADLAD